MDHNGAALGTNGYANCMYAMDQEKLEDVLTGMLKVFTHYVYALLDLVATLPFVTLYISMRFEISPKSLFEPSGVSTVNPLLSKESIGIIQCQYTIKTL